MRRALVSLWLVAPLAACGGKSDSAGTAAGSGSAVAAPAGSGSAAMPAPAPAAAAPKAAYCIASDSNNSLISFTADDNVATMCLGKEDSDKAPPRCTEIDLATGAHRASTAAPPAKTKPPEPAFAVKQDAKGVSVCKGDACKKLDLPKPKVEGGEVQPYHVAVSADGKHVVASGGGLDGVAFLDGATGKRRRTAKIDGEGTCLEGARFVGDTVYVATSNCAGPGGGALLFSAQGAQLAELATEEKINTYGAEPRHLGGDRWAIVGFGGGDVLIFDARTGKQLHLVAAKWPEPCAPCGDLGNAVNWRGSPLAVQPSGKLVVLDARGVMIVDPATGAIEKQHATPICPEP